MGSTPTASLEQTLYARPTIDQFVHHSDRLVVAGIDPSVGSVGD